jgi:hypothetical protein
MNITFTPARMDTLLEATVEGDSLTLNDERFDFSPLQEGDVLPRAAVACAWLASDVTREGGRITLTLVLPHGANAPEETRFPAPILAAPDGPLPIPTHSAEEDPAQ